MSTETWAEREADLLDQHRAARAAGDTERAIGLARQINTERDERLSGETEEQA